MKKIIVFALCILLVAAVAVPVFATEDTKVTVTASASELERGDTVVFTISVSGDVPFTSFMVDLNFSDTYFEYVGSEVNTNIGNATLLEYSPSMPELGLAFMSGGSGTVNTWVQKLTFKVKSTAPLEKVTVKPVSPSTNTDTVNCEGVTVSVDCNHAYPKNSDGLFIYTQEGGKHKQTCEKCGTPKLEDHDWNDGEGQPSCEQTVSVKYTCLICQTTKTEDVAPIGHKYDNDCDDTCNNNCGTTREVTHNYVLVNTNSEGHWYECTVCEGMKPGSWEAHTPGEEATADTAQVCTVCEYVIKQALGHQDVWEEGWTTDSVYHWHRCQTKKCYNVTAKAKHDYDNDCDVDCNTCGYIRVAPHNYKPEWQANAQGHWQICADCNVKSEVYEHEPGPEATMDTPQICTECNIVIKRELSHEHNYGDAWYSDDNSHWQSCSECQEATELEPHAWDEGVELEDGKLQYTCSVCEKQIVTDAQIETEPSTEPSLPQATEPTDSGSFPWQWAGIAAIVLLIVGIVLLVIEFIRSRKTNMHGKFSK